MSMKAQHEKNVKDVLAWRAEKLSKLAKKLGEDPATANKKAASKNADRFVRQNISLSDTVTALGLPLHTSAEYICEKYGFDKPINAGGNGKFFNREEVEHCLRLRESMRSELRSALLFLQEVNDYFDKYGF